MSIQLSDVAKEIEKLRSKKIVFTGGCFDIFHQGHLEFLRKASEHGDILVVQVDSDKFIKENKGASRPVFDEKFRAELVSALQFVDFVFIADKKSYSPEILSKLKPDVLVVSRSNEKDINKSLKRESGQLSKIKIVYLKPLQGISTTQIIEDLKNKR